MIRSNSRISNKQRVVTVKRIQPVISWKAAAMWLVLAGVGTMHAATDSANPSVAAAEAAPPALRFHGLFADHMVMQRDASVPVYGEGRPGAGVSVRLGEVVRETRVQPGGRWEVDFPPFPAGGGPQRIEARADGISTSVEDVLFGDVWLASGQSNMEWKVGGGVLDMEKEIAAADFPGVRFFVVPKRLSDVPLAGLADGQWQVCSPQSIGQCSAVAWFFAREIFKETGIPIGIVVSAAGGTPVEAWMSPQAMQRFPNPKQEMLDQLNAKYGSWTKHIEENERNIQRLVQQVDTSMDAVAAGVLNPGFDDSAWTNAGLFADPPQRNCLRWWRQKLTLTAEQAAAPLVLSLARPDAVALVHVNGRKVADVRGRDCRVELPAGTFQAGENLIVVRLGNYWGVPRFAGKAEEAFLATADGAFRHSLAAGWKFSDAMEPPLTKWLPMADIPSALFNGMIHPLLRSPIKGAIWYQGEANTGDPSGYAVKFPLMISDWRVHFRQGYFPFHFVQLANFGAPSELPSQDGWPLLREAQAATLRFPDTGMAVAIDVGEALDIHPQNKQAVGHRLALQALAASYGKSLEASGPVYRKQEIRVGALVIHFDHSTGLTTSDGQPPRSFAIAGADRRFHLARAAIEGNTVVLSSDAVPAPVAARYAFADSPVVNLVNAAGLPACPFRSDDWSELSKTP